jgi:epoxyqueuosine reductase
VSVVEALQEKVKASGWRAAVAPYARRAEAIKQVASRHERGELDEAFYQEYLAPMLADPPPETPPPRSLILVAMPDYPVRIQFTLDGKPFPVTVAPGYVRRPRRTAAEVVGETLSPFGFSATRASGPQKAIVTLSGFARYGRNNISYVPDLGSFHALAVLVSDLPCAEEPPHEQEMLPRCRTCQACRAACPTGAIGGDRFLLHAERCISFWNEKAPEIPFPEWMKPRWHNALFGCLLCQQACPENRPLKDQTIEGPTFDERTTQALLAGAKLEDLPEEVQPTLREWRLADLLAYLPRNLGALAAR